MMHRATSFVLAFVLALTGALNVQAQSQDDAISTNPTVPTVNQPVTITFDASGTPLEGLGEDVYAHTGVTTDQSDPEWTCVKNFWPTQNEFSGERADTRLTQVDTDLYELEISDIRAYYNDNETGCTLGQNEVIQTMNFVFRDTDGDTQTDDKFVALGDSDAPLFVTITQPSVSGINPFIIEDGETIEIEAEAIESGENLEEMVLTIDGQQEASTTETMLSVSTTFTDTGNREVEVTATGDQGSEVSDRLTILVSPPVEERARPAGVEDGITYNSDGSVTLSFYGPGKDFAYAIGDFSNWEVDNDYFMYRESTNAFGDNDGAHWWTTIDGLTPGEEYRFQYLVDGEIRMGDLFSEKVLTPRDRFIDESTYPNLIPYPEDETEGFVSVLQTGQSAFNFSDFERPPADELVIYEYLIRDFNDEKTYASIIDELDYLEGLGINAIELMPVSNFDGNISWGYNPNFHLALEKSYGPAEDFKQFVEEAHQRGIAVILDVVYNHATDPSPLIQLEGNDPGQSRFVGPGHDFNVFNHLNHDHKYIQYWVDRANAHWLEKYNVDGYRFDLTKGFVTKEPDNDFEVGGFNPNTFDQRRIDNLQRMADAMWDVDNSSYIILEHFQRDEELQMADYQRGEGRQGMMFWQGMNGNYSEAAMGFLNNTSNLAATYHPNIGLDIEVGNAITYMESHDEQWLMRRMQQFGNASDDGSYDTTDLEVALERQKLMGGFFLTVPGPRMLWQLGELGYGWGDNECLKPGGFGDDGDCAANDPGRTDPKPVRTEEYFNDPDRRAVYETWGALLNLRQEFEPMRSLASVERLDVGPGNDPIRHITLTEGSQQVHIVGNFGLAEAETDLSFLENGTWYDFFPGEAFEVDDENRNDPVTMQPSQFHVLVNEPVAFPEEDWLGYGLLQSQTLEVAIDRGFGGTPVDAANYRLVALPGDVNLSLAQAVSGRAERDWQAYLDDGSDEDFLIAFDGSDAFDLRPGNGFWLTSRANWTFSDTVEQVPVDSETGTVAIDLQEGWNIISNPLGQSVDWEAVDAANAGELQPIHGFDGAFSESSTFTSATEGVAYYFFNDDPGRDALNIPLSSSSAATTSSAATSERPAALSLTARPAHAEDDQRTASAVYLGVDGEQASVIAPPQSFEALSLRIQPETEEAASERARLSTREYRAMNGEGESFALTLSAAESMVVSLTAGQWEAVRGYQVALIDAAKGTVHDMRPGEPVTVDAGADATPLRVAIGTQAYIEEQAHEALPTEVSLRAYPNPVRDQATIAYTLTEADDVRVELFDMLGRRVKVIEDRAQQAGTHEAQFSADGLASGVYFGRLHVGGETLTQKITVVR